MFHVFYFTLLKTCFNCKGVAGHCAFIHGAGGSLRAYKMGLRLLKRLETCVLQGDTITINEHITHRAIFFSCSLDQNILLLVMCPFTAKQRCLQFWSAHLSLLRHFKTSWARTEMRSMGGREEGNMAARLLLRCNEPQMSSSDRSQAVKGEKLLSPGQVKRCREKDEIIIYQV